MLRFIPRRSQYLFALTGLVFLLLVVFRTLFWIGVSDLPVEANRDFFQAFWIGIRFDLRIALLLALCTLPLILVPRFNALRNNLMLRLLKWLVALLLLVLIGANVIDAGHYFYLGTRLDASVARFATNPQESALMVWQSYPVIFIVLGVLMLWWCMNQLHRLWIVPLLQQPNAALPWWHKTLAVMLVVVVMFMMLLGRWSLTPLRWNHAYFNGDAEVAALGLNPLVRIYDTFEFIDLPISRQQLAPYLPVLKSVLGGDFITDGHGALDRINTPVNPVVPVGETPNIVLVFMESLGASHIGAYGNPLNPTPNIDDIIRQSRWYPNFVVPSRSTAKSVFAFITGIPDVSTVSTASRNPYITHQRSLLNHFDNYEKYYMIGGSAGWANVSATIINSINNIKLYEEQNWQSPREDVWGIHDRDLVDESLGVLQQAQAPFLAIIQTAANHPPYTIPDDVPNFVIKEVSSQALEAGVFESQAQYNAVRLLDYNIGYLIEQFKDQGLYEDTIFVFYSDHQAHGNQTAFLPAYIDQFGLGELPVPLIMHSPKYIPPEKDLTYGNLVDVLPTVAGLFFQPYLNTTLGRDLKWAQGKHLPAYGLIQDERKSLMFNANHIVSFNQLTKEAKAAMISAQGRAQYISVDEPAARIMLQQADAFYVAAHYLFRANVKPRSTSQ